jgi:hypothetical protein
MHEGESIGVEVRLQGGFVHEAVNRKVGEKKAVELLLDQLGILAAQNRLSATQIES